MPEFSCMSARHYRKEHGGHAYTFNNSASGQISVSRVFFASYINVSKNTEAYK